MVHPSDHHLVVGQKGEQLAEAFLKKRGYHLLGRNVRTEGGEVDLVARDGEVIVFVEVKARAKHDGFDPSDRVDRIKVQRLKNAAECWLNEQEEEFSARIDVIGVCEGKVVEHFEDVGV